MTRPDNSLLSDVIVVSAYKRHAKTKLERKAYDRLLYILNYWYECEMKRVNEAIGEKV